MCCQWEKHLAHRPVVHFCISLTMGVPESDRFTLQEHTASLCCLSLSLSPHIHIHTHTIDPSLKRLRINEQSTRLIQFSLRHGGDAIQAPYPPPPPLHNCTLLGGYWVITLCPWLSTNPSHSCPVITNGEYHSVTAWVKLRSSHSNKCNGITG